VDKKGPYKYHEVRVPSGGYQNTTDQFQVIVGMDMGPFQATGDNVRVNDPTNAYTLDSNELFVSGAPLAGLQGIWLKLRPMLIPPSHLLFTTPTDTQPAMIVDCCCLEKALAIL